MRKKDELEIKLNDVMFLALDHGMNSISENAGPLIPFVVAESADGERKMARFVTKFIEEGVEKAREYIETNKNDLIRYAIAWDGFITMEGKKWDAVFVEAGDKVQESGLQLCQRYELKGLLKKKNIPVGNPALIGKPKSRIK